MKTPHYGMTGINQVCKDCTKRHVGCHSTCMDYILAIADWKINGEQRRKEIQTATDLYWVKHDRVCHERKKV